MSGRVVARCAVLICLVAGLILTLAIAPAARAQQSSRASSGSFVTQVTIGDRAWSLKIQPFSTEVVKIHFSPSGEFEPSGLERYGFIDPGEPVSLTVQDDGNEIILTAGDNTITIDKDPFRLEINRGTPSSLSMSDLVTDGSLGTATFRSGRPEHFLGLGQRYSRVDQAGKRVVEEIRAGVDDERSLSGTPFFMSSAGYGIFVDTTYETSFDLTQPAMYAIQTRDPQLRYFYIHGPGLKDILRRYTDITGKPSLPPRWTFGYWQSKFGYNNRPELEEVARLMRLLDFPCDALVLDYYWRNNEGLSWDETHFPDHQAMLRGLGHRGFKVVLHEDTAAIRVYPVSGDWLYPVTGFDMFYGPGEFPIKTFPEVILDVSNPDASRWYWGHLHVPLLDEGAAAFWIDEIDWAPEDGDEAFFDHSLPPAMHNLYPNLFNKNIFENMETAKIGDANRRGAILTRSMWAGSQRHGWVWSGDVASTFKALKEQVVAGQTMGLSGFPFWGNDLGGFVMGFEGFFVADDPTTVPLKQSDEIQIRWSAEFGAFSPLFRVHGMGTEIHTSAVGGKEPWAFGPQAQKIFRMYDKLRYRLIPYIYSVAHEATRSGLPLMRSLALDFQEDEQAYSQDTEYMFGPAFLVAPVVEEGATARDVYLPEGRWIDYWTNQGYRGPGTIRREAPLDTLPLFVKEGSIVPMGPSMTHTDEKPLDPLSLWIYPLADGDFTLYEDDGATLAYRSGEFAQTPLGVKSGSGVISIHVGVETGAFAVPDRGYELVVNCIDRPQSVTVDGEPSGDVKYQAKKRRAVIRLPARPSGFDVALQAGVGCN